MLYKTFGNRILRMLSKAQKKSKNYKHEIT